MPAQGALATRVYFLARGWPSTRLIRRLRRREVSYPALYKTVTCFDAHASKEAHWSPRNDGHAEAECGLEIDVLQERPWMAGIVDGVAGEAAQ